jgi:hypothetical protein
MGCPRGYCGLAAGCGKVDLVTVHIGARWRDLPSDSALHDALTTMTRSSRSTVTL